MREGSCPGAKHKLEGWLQTGSKRPHTVTVLSEMLILMEKKIVVMVLNLPTQTTTRLMAGI